MREGRPVFVTLVGSLQRGSSSRAVANTLDELAPDHVQVETLPSVGRLPPYCVGDPRFGIPATLAAMSAAITAADAVVVVTPEYRRSIPGSLKNALDWLANLPDPAFRGKPVAIQTLSPGMSGGLRAHDHLRQTLASMGAMVIHRPQIIIPFVTGKIDLQANCLRDAETRCAITCQLEALAQLSRDGRGE